MQRACLLDAAATVHLLERCDALRKPERFSQALQVCEVQAYALEKLEGRPEASLCANHPSAGGVGRCARCGCGRDCRALRWAIPGH
jgi:tRNA nucleotidyltransferase (CCA-adding enzyme)